MVDRYHKFPDFDPAWTQIEAWEASFKNKKNNYARWKVWQDLHEDLKTSYESGRVFALLQALRLCADVDLPMPDWVASGFSNRFDGWIRLEYKNLEEAFDCKIKKNFRFKSEKLYLDKSLQIVEVISTQRIWHKKSMKEAIKIAKEQLDLKISDRTVTAIYSKKMKELGARCRTRRKNNRNVMQKTK